MIINDQMQVGVILRYFYAQPARAAFCNLHPQQMALATIGRTWPLWEARSMPWAQPRVTQGR